MGHYKIFFLKNDVWRVVTLSLNSISGLQRMRYTVFAIQGAFESDRVKSF